MTKNQKIGATLLAVGLLYAGGASLDVVPSPPEISSRYVGGWPFRPTLPIPPEGETGGGGSTDSNPDDDVFLNASNFTLLGSFTLPVGADGSPQDIAQGGVLGLADDGKSLYVGCHEQESYAMFTIPELGGEAVRTKDCSYIPGDVDLPETGNHLGSFLVWNNRLIVSKYEFYDGDDNGFGSHMANSNVNGTGTWTDVIGLTPGVGLNPGHTGGYMGIIPQHWRSRFSNNPAMSGQGGLSRIGRTSSGPGLHAFNPDVVNNASPDPTYVTPMVYYTTENPLNAINPAWFKLGTLFGGVAWPIGSKSVLVIGSLGLDPHCYGNGTSVPEEEGTQCRLPGDAEVCCYDPTDGAKGDHSFPYEGTIWAYDANDLARVAAGTATPYSIAPHAVFAIPGLDANCCGVYNGYIKARRGGTTFDPATNRIYMALDWGTYPRVYVIQVTVPTT